MSQIPVVILCGGQGTRMRGDTQIKKELVEIGGRPILWHVMRIYSAYGHDNFILTLGYKAAEIKRYFLNYQALTRDATLTIGAGGAGTDIAFHDGHDHPAWQVALVDTGRHTDKASRIARVRPLLTGDHFFVTYGEGVGNVDLDALLAFHLGHGKLATITAVQVHFQYGVVEADEAGHVSALREKPRLPHWINAGFMLFNRSVLDWIPAGDDADLENDLLPRLAAAGELMVHRHRGFWQSMDTLKDTMRLQELWQESAPWKVW